MAWLIGKKKSNVKNRVDIFEAASGSETLFANLARDDFEERAVKEAAAAKERATGGWLAQQGRVHDNVIDRSYIGLVELFTAPGHLDGYLILALATAILHLILLASWLLVASSACGNAAALIERSLEAATMSDTSTRLSTMYTCGHVLWFGKLIHVCVGSEVQKFTPFYLPLMLLCVLIGGPACAMAVSAHCEEHARLKAELLNTKQHYYFPKDELVETKAEISDAMQWIWLLVLAATVAGSASAFGSSSLMPDPTDGSYDASAILLFIFWPVDLARLATLTWLTPLTGIMVVDWLGILLVGLLIAAADGSQEGPGLLGVSKELDVILRCGLVLVCTFPTPYVGLALYLLLDTRQKAENPLLPPFTGGLRGPQKPRAMTAWEARVYADANGRALI